jgi:hypothetical protein
MADFKYKTSFSFEVQACQEIADVKISKATIQNLKPLIPNEVDLNRNIDLMGVAFNAAVVNEFNKNGDGMNTATAKDCLKNFIYKPTNIEHDKKRVVGVILKAGFSDYADSSLMVDVDDDEKKPFNIALGAVVYKTVDKEFFNTLKRSTDPNSKIHNKVSASWEIGFTDYHVAIGSKNLKDCQIITDQKEIERLKPFLKGFGGKGVTDKGIPVSRLITGKCYPLGIGYTMKPAANVEGVISEKEEEPKETKVKSEGDASTLQIISDKISQKIKNTVNNNNIMDLENLLTELKSDLQEKKFSQEAIAGMTSTFADAIKTKDEEYKASLESAENEKAEIAKANEELKASVESIQEELTKAQERIGEFEKAQAAVEAEALFNSRMEEIDSIYDLEESDSSFIAQKIKGLDSSEEAFASLKGELEVFWASKNKEKLALAEAEVEARVTEEVEKRLKDGYVVASEQKEDVDVEEALSNAEATTAEIPNNNEAQASTTKSLKDRFAAAFSRDNILS